MLEQQQDWLVPAPIATKLCFTVNVLLALTSGALLVSAFLWWATSASEISVSVRNHALGYGFGAGIIGLVLLHIFFMKTLMKTLMKGNGWLIGVNTVLGVTLTGLALGTIE